MLTFDSPTFALLFFIFPFLIYFFHLRNGTGGKVSYSFSIWGSKTNYLHSSRGGLWLGASSYFFFWCSGALMVIGLMGPAHSQQKLAYLDRGINIMFVLDESPTMGALDFGSLSRFEHAISILESFVRSADNDLIGFITFATEAVVRTPLTQDYDFFLSKLDNLYLMDLGNKTAIGNALGLALLNMTYATSSTKIVVLMTDGVLNTGTKDIEGLISLANKMNVRIYTLGIGTKDRVAVSFTTRNGKVYRGTVSESYNDAMLKKIAKETGGKFFAASSSYLLSSAIAKIFSLEESEKRVRLDVTHTSMVSFFMWWSLIFLVTYFLLRFFILDAFL